MLDNFCRIDRYVSMGDEYNSDPSHLNWFECCSAGKIAHSKVKNTQAELVDLFLAALKATGDQPPHLLSLLTTTPSQDLMADATGIRNHLESGLKRLDQESTRHRQRAQQREHNESKATDATDFIEIGQGKRRKS